MKEKGGCCNNEEELVEEISEFYSKMFTSEDTMRWEDKLDSVSSTIIDLMNSRRIRPVENSEIKKAFSMNQNKVPGMDGITPLFFQSFWNIIQEYICNVVKIFFSNKLSVKTL